MRRDPYELLVDPVFESDQALVQDWHARHLSFMYREYSMARAILGLQFHPAGAGSNHFTARAPAQQRFRGPPRRQRGVLGADEG